MDKDTKALDNVREWVAVQPILCIKSEAVNDEI